MLKLAFAVCALLLAGGCKDKWEKAISDMEGFKDKMCACKDKDCLKGVEKDMEEWEKSMKDKFGKDEKPSDKLIERIEKVDKDMEDCKKAVKKAAGAGEAEAAMKKMTEFKDQMCACKDTACAQKVSDDMTKWGTEQAKNGDAPPMDEAMTKKATEIGEQMGKCMQAAMSAPTGGSATP